jgi:hypothetical protein
VRVTCVVAPIIVLLLLVGSNEKYAPTEVALYTAALCWCAAYCGASNGCVLSREP